MIFLLVSNFLKFVLGVFYPDDLNQSRSRCSSSSVINICSFCDYSTSNKSHFKRHILAHSGQRPYKCNVCNKSFGRKDNLKTHIYTHKQDRPYCCEACGKSFLTKQSLQLHKCSIQFV